MALHLLSRQETEYFTNWRGGTSSLEHCRAAAGTLKLSWRFSAHAPLRCPAGQAVLLMQRSGYTASTALLQRATRIRHPWQENIKQERKWGSKRGGIKRNQTGLLEDAPHKVLKLDSCHTLHQLHVSMQVSIFSNPAEKFLPYSKPLKCPLLIFLFDKAEVNFGCSKFF